MIDKRLFSLAFSEKFSPQIIINVIISYLFIVLSIPQAYLIADWIARHKRGKDFLTIEIILSLILIIIARGILHYYSEFRWNTFSSKIKHYLRKLIFKNSIELNYRTAKSINAADGYMVFTQSIENLDDFFSGFLPRLIMAALFPLTVLVVTLFYDIFTFSIFLITLPIIPFFMYLIGKWVSSLTLAQWEKLFWLGNYLYDRISGLISLRNYSVSKKQYAILKKVSNEYKDATLDVLKIAFISALTLELLATLSTAIIAVEIGLRLLFGHISFHLAMFILIIAPEFYLALRNLGSGFHAAQGASEAAVKIFGFNEMLKNKSEFFEEKKFSAAHSSVLKIIGGSFTYDHKREVNPVFDDIQINIKNTDINSDSVIYIIGESGSGKSTLLELLSGHLLWNKGSSLVTKGAAKKDAPNQKTKALDKNSVFLLPHSGNVFPASIAQNISLTETFSESKIKNALKSIELKPRVKQLRDGLSTRVHSEFSEMSSGEIQRVSLARIFYHDHYAAYFLDEPYAFLDHAMVMRLHTRLLKKYIPEKRVIIATHRIDMIRSQDYVIVLKDKKISFHGKHKDLMKMRNDYNAYYTFNKKIYG